MKTIFTEHPALMIVLQSVVLLALAFAVINVLMARRSAGTRHLAWVFSMGALLALPALWQVLPGWGVFPSPGGAVPPTVTETDDGPAFVPALARTPAFDDLAPAATPKIPATDPVLLPPAIPDEGAKTSYLEWLGAIWLAGVGILLVRLLLSRLFLAFAARKARLVTRGPLFEEVESVRAKIGIGRKIRLCLSPATAGKTMPMTWGVFRPVLILPTEIEDWGSERTAVLQHELAHIRRWDAATHLLVQTACALYWFNPLVWLAARRIHLERERACDDFVLRSQAVKPSAYADCLLRILTGLDAGRLGQNATAIAIAMSAPGKSQLEKRLQTITADGIDRRPVSTWSFALVLLAVVSLVLPVAMLRAADEKEKNPKPIKEKSVSPEPAAVEPKVLDPVPAIVSGDFDGDRDLDVYINQKNGRFRMLEDGQVVLVEASHKKGEAPLVGIGVVLQESDDGIKVGRILENSPASESGLEVHDRLTGVAQGENGKMIDVRDLDLVSLVQLIRGREGSKVRLRLIPADGGDEVTVSIPRSALNLKQENQSESPLPPDDGIPADPARPAGVITTQTEATTVTTQTETSTSRRKGGTPLEIEIRDIPAKKEKVTNPTAPTEVPPLGEVPLLPLPERAAREAESSAKPTRSEDPDGNPDLAPEVALPSSILKTDSWRNFYFSSHLHNPLWRDSYTVHSVKILGVDRMRRSWVKVTFPEKRTEHYDLEDVVAKASEEKKLSLDQAIADWERGVTRWRTTWINLDHVVNITEIDMGPVVTDTKDYLKWKE